MENLEKILNRCYKDNGLSQEVGERREDPDIDN
jgi:hypothetical protein